MKFTRENYEFFVIDYLEGNLNSKDMEEFGSFLNLNPDINESLNSFDEFSLYPNDTVFQNKTSLKKEEIDLLNNIPENELKCIAYLENDLEIDEAGAFIDMTSENPEYLALLNKYRNSILTPQAIQFPDKKQLKKAVPIFFRKLIWIPSAAAAIILILFSIRVLVMTPSPTEPVSPQITQSQQEGQNKTYSENSKSESPTFKDSQLTLIENSETAIGEELPIQASNTKILVSKNLNDDNNPELSDRNLMAYAIPLLEGKYETIQPRKSDYLKLDPPVIYIPRELSPQVLSAFEAYTIEDFKVRLVESISQEPPPTPLLVALAGAGIKGANKITGGNMKLNTASNKHGKLTAFAFDSRGLKISSSLKK